MLAFPLNINPCYKMRFKMQSKRDDVIQMIQAFTETFTAQFKFAGDSILLAKIQSHYSALDENDKREISAHLIRKMKEGLKLFLPRKENFLDGGLPAAPVLPIIDACLGGKMTAARILVDATVSFFSGAFMHRALKTSPTNPVILQRPYIKLQQALGLGNVLTDVSVQRSEFNADMESKNPGLHRRRI